MGIIKKYNALFSNVTKTFFIFHRCSMITAVLFPFMVTIGDSKLFEIDKSLSFHRNLSKCVLEIVETYFNLDVSVAIQTPEMWYRKHHSIDHETISSFGDILLETISSAALISYFTLGFVKDFKKQLNKIKPGSYIFVVSAKYPHKAIDMFLRSRYNARNRAAKVIVVNLEPLQIFNQQIATARDSLTNS